MNRDWSVSLTRQWVLEALWHMPRPPGPPTIVRKPDRNRRMRRWIIATLFACLVAASVHAGELLPELPVQTLDGKGLSLPAAWPAQPVLLIAGFSRASRDPCRTWSERLRSEPPADLAVYQMAVIDDVPGLLRGLVTRGMRKGVPSALHERFLLVTEQGQAWRQLADYAQPDTAYLLLFDARHQLRWHSAGPMDEISYRALLDAVAQLAAMP